MKRDDEREREPRREPFNEYSAVCAYCTAQNPINAERCCACARLNWRRP